MLIKSLYSAILAALCFSISPVLWAEDADQSGKYGEPLSSENLPTKAASSSDEHQSQSDKN